MENKQLMTPMKSVMYCRISTLNWKLIAKKMPRNTINPRFSSRRYLFCAMIMQMKRKKRRIPDAICDPKTLALAIISPIPQIADPMYPYRECGDKEKD